MKAAHVKFQPRTRAATWREQYEAVVIGQGTRGGSLTVVVWRLAGATSARDDVVATLDGRRELERLARTILRRLATAKHADSVRRRRRALRVVHGGRR